MKILITGANGGVGRNLIHFLKDEYNITGLIRDHHCIPPANRNINYIKGDIRDTTLMRIITKKFDVLIHAAIAFKKGMHQESLIGLESILNSLSPSTLFVYFSSMVVYSNQNAKNSLGYDETLPLISDKKIDGYTKTKIDGEKHVIEFCQKRNIPYIILRPTIIFGEHMTWSKIGLRLAKWFPFPLSNYHADFIHVEDFSKIIGHLIKNQKARNQIFNIGGHSYKFHEFMQIAGRCYNRKIKSKQSFFTRLLVSPITSSFWFLKKDVIINSNKVRNLTGYNNYKTLEDFFEKIHFKKIAPKSTEEFTKNLLKSPHSYTPVGNQLSFILTKNPPQKTILNINRSNYNKILNISEKEVTVQCGISLYELTEALDRRNLTLATLPEFLDVTVGACLATPVHGSSLEYANVASLVKSVTYIHKNDLFTINREHPSWNTIIFSNDPDIFFLEATIECIPSHYMTRIIEWHPENTIIPQIRELFAKHHSCTIEWYPEKKFAMVWKMDRINHKLEKTRKTPKFIRSQTPVWMRHIPFKRGVFTDKSHHILGSWKKINPIIKFLLEKNKKNVSCEFAIPLENCDVFFKNIQNVLAQNTIPLKSLGIRCSSEDSFINSPSFGKKVVWIETAELLWTNKIKELASEVGYKNHWGKLLP